MTDRELLIIAVTAGVINAIAAIPRTIWQWEKRRESRRPRDGQHRFK